MSDLVERLRFPTVYNLEIQHKTQAEAADEIECLRSERDILRAALERIAKWEPESSEAWMLRSICVEALQEGSS